METEFEFLDDEPVVETPPAPEPVRQEPSRKEQDQQRFNQQLQQERQQQAPQQPQVNNQEVDRYVDERAMNVAQNQAALQLAIYKTEQKYPELNSPQARGWVGQEATRIAQEAQAKGEYLTHEQVLEAAAQSVKKGIQDLSQSTRQPIDRLAIDMGVGAGDAPTKQTRLTVDQIKNNSPADHEKLKAKVLAQQYNL